MQSCLEGLPRHQEWLIGMALRRWQLQRRFFRRFGQYIDFEAPSTVQEKTQYRKLFGNHELYAFLADKYRVRQYVEERVGGEILIPLLGVHERLTPQAFADLPEQFIIKANHGCKWHKIVKNKAELDTTATIRYFHKLLRCNYARASGEHHYTFIKPLIVIETLLVDRGDSPPDYHFYCFHNKSGFDYLLAASMPGGERTMYFDKQWNPTRGNCTPEEIKRLQSPRNLSQMVHIAEELSRGFDFLRIDLYNVEGQIYFGEITSTPASGMRKFDDPAQAAERNALWQLDVHNPLLYRSRRAA